MGLITIEAEWARLTAECLSSARMKLQSWHLGKKNANQPHIVTCHLSTFSLETAEIK